VKKLLRQPWVLALAAVAAATTIWVAFFAAPGLDPTPRGPAHAGQARDHLDHGPFFERPFDDPRDVTRACLACHETAAGEVMRTSHWSWLGDGQLFPGRDRYLRVGKRNLINNFCIGVKGNWASCTSCHAREAVQVWT